MNTNIMRLLSEITSTEKRLAELKEELKAARNSIVRPTPKYEIAEVSVVKPEAPGWGDDLAYGTLCIRFVLALTNNAEAGIYMAATGETRLSGWDEQRYSLTYFYLNGLLCSTGSGTLLLKTRVSITPGEWDRLKIGDIPSHLLLHPELLAK